LFGNFLNKANVIKKNKYYAALVSMTDINITYRLGLNRVSNFAEHRVFEAVFAEYRVPIRSS